jgi:fatty acid desaturase
VSDVTPVLKKMSPAHRRECVASFYMTLALNLGLLVADWRATLFFWVPVTWFVSTAILVLYNYTDHVPSQPGDPLRYATYDALRSPYRRLLSSLDLHNIATHITHHRFPHVYWSDLPRVQAEQVATYEAHGTPRTQGLNSAILFNPVAFLLMAYRVNRLRHSVPVKAAGTTP